MLAACETPDCVDAVAVMLIEEADDDDDEGDEELEPPLACSL
jgi:hypothetical protein